MLKIMRVMALGMALLPTQVCAQGSPQGATPPPATTQASTDPAKRCDDLSNKAKKGQALTDSERDEYVKCLEAKLKSLTDDTLAPAVRVPVPK